MKDGEVEMISDRGKMERQTDTLIGEPVIIMNQRNVTGDISSIKHLVSSCACNQALSIMHRSGLTCGM